MGRIPQHTLSGTDDEHLAQLARLSACDVRSVADHMQRKQLARSLVPTACRRMGLSPRSLSRSGA